MDIEKRIDDDEDGLMTMMIEIILLAMSGAMDEIDANGILAREVMIVITEMSHIIEIGTNIKTDTTIRIG